MTFSFSISGYPKPKLTWSMKTKTQENQTRFRVLADKFEMSDVRFEDEGVITGRAENMFGIQVTEVKITVKGEYAHSVKCENETQIKRVTLDADSQYILMAADCFS